MLRTKWMTTVLMVACLGLIGGCNGGSSGGGDDDTASLTADMALVVRIDDVTSFLNLADASVDTHVTNDNGTELESSMPVFGWNGYLYTAGSVANDNIAKYEIQEDRTLLKVAETNVFEGGNSIPTQFIFASESKAYVPLSNAAQLLVVNLDDLSISKRIDLSAYAMDSSGEFGGSDVNPEPSGGVISDGILYLGLAQIDSFSTYASQGGKASMLLIDVETDEILKHISDDRAATTGCLSPNYGFTVDENGDVYVNHTAAFGYYPGISSGILRIRKGAEEFDPDYFIPINGRTDLDIPGGVASYMYNDMYAGNGKLYALLFVPGLASNPPDYANDKNYQPYEIDLYNQTLTKLDMPPTIGWSTCIIPYEDSLVFGMTTENGAGLYRIGDTEPFLTTEGSPFFLTTF